MPRDVIGQVVDNGREGVMSPDTHLMDDEDGREWRMAMALPWNGRRLGSSVRISEPVSCESRPKAKANQTHIWTETDEVVVLIEKPMMVWAHKQATAWFMMRFPFGLQRDPTAVLEVGPLSRISLDLRRVQMPFDLQRTPVTAAMLRPTSPTYDAAKDSEEHVSIF